MSRLSICLLGSFQVSLSLDGEPVDGFESDKVRALLAYLVVEAKRPFRRELLTGLLWPDMPESQARVNLRRALKNLRDAIGDRQATPPFLFISRTEIQFNAGSDYELDLHTFWEKLADKHHVTKMASLQTAVSLYQGDFLAGFSIADSTAFEEWLLLKREQQRRLAWEAHHTLANFEARNGRFSQALHHAQRQVEIEPLQETSHRQLMRYLCYTNRQNEALAHFQTLREMLQTELNVAPDAKTRRLYEAIRDGELRVPSETAVPHNLPPQPTPFVGRDDELDRLDRLIAAPESRLITIHGVGGTGKTRLALAAAQRQRQMLVEHNATLQSRFPDGVFFVALAPLQAPDQILPTVAEVLHFRLHRGGQETRTPQQQLLDFLKNKCLLLILDNFEHVLDGCDLLSHMMEAAPNVQIVVTSRERLRLRWEQVFPLDGLTYPNTNGESAIPLTTYTAVQLFHQAATRILPDFQLTPPNEASMTTICQMVEGMPLALELAAAWVESLSLPTIADLIQQGIDALQSDYRDIPVRHRSITAVFDTSWQQLTKNEQQLLARIAIFHSPFSAEAASFIATANAPMLSRFVHKSLLHFNAQTNRYHLHQLLKQFASVHLEADDNLANKTNDLHSAYFLDFVTQISPELISETQKAAFSRIEAMSEDVRAAWEWACLQKDSYRLGEAVNALCRSYLRYARFEEATMALETAVSHLNHQITPATIRPLLRCRTWLGSFYYMQDRHDNAKEQFQICQQLLEEPAFAKEDLRQETAWLFFEYSMTMSITGERGIAKQYIYKSLELSRSIDDKWLEAYALNRLSSLIYIAGSYNEGYELKKKCAALFREIGDLAYLAYTLEHLGEYAIFQGLWEEAERYIDEALKFHRAVDNKVGIASNTFEKAVPLFWQGEYAAANEYTIKSAKLYKEIGVDEALEFSFAVNNIHLGQYDIAQDYAQKGVAVYQRQQNMRNWALCLAVQGWIALAREKYKIAAQHLREAEKIFIDIGQQGEIGWVHFPLALVSSHLGQIKNARLLMHGVTTAGANIQDFTIATCALAGTAVLLCNEPALEDKIKGIKLHALAMAHGWVANSKWFEDIVGRYITAVANTLPPDMVKHATAQGAAKELWATMDALSVELSARGWGEMQPDRVISAKESDSVQSKPADITPAQTTARYIQQSRIGEGGYGEIFLGLDTTTGKQVAIKQLKIVTQASIVQRFKREGEALQQLNHPNIVQMLDMLNQDGQPQIIMEYVPGGSLRDLLEQGKLLPLDQVLSTCLELADALARAHHLGVIHRDLKPANVLLADDGTPRLTDFGIAHFRHHETHLTQEGTIIGSPTYMSPEACMGEPLDERTDIWAFGVLLFELLTGRLPFEGDSITAVIAAILNAPVPDLTQLREHVPSPLQTLIEKMLVKDRSRRLSSMRSIAAELEHIRSRY